MADDPMLISFVQELADLETRIALLSGGDGNVRVADLESAYEELRVAEEELRAQRGELDRLISHHESEVARQDHVLEILPLAIVKTDRAGTITWINSAASQLLGVPAQFLVGKPVQSFVAKQDRHTVRRVLNQYAAGTAMNFAVSLSDRGGRVVAAHARIVDAPAQPGRGPSLVWTLQPAASSVGFSVMEAVIGIASLPASPARWEEGLQAAAAITATALGTPSVAICFTSDGLPPVIAATDDRAHELTRLQATFAEGPAGDTRDSRAAITTESLKNPARWPHLGRSLVDDTTCVTAYLAIGDLEPATITAYDVAPDPDLPERLLLIARALETLHEHVKTRHEVEHELKHLRAAFATHPTIDIARGILMQRHGISSNEAWNQLKQLSMNANTKLRDVAVSIVDQANRPPGDGKSE